MKCGVHLDQLAGREAVHVRRLEFQGPSVPRGGQILLGVGILLRGEIRDRDRRLLADVRRGRLLDLVVADPLRRERLGVAELVAGAPDVPVSLPQPARMTLTMPATTTPIRLR
jgi:hypothetical protein